MKTRKALPKVKVKVKPKPNRTSIMESAVMIQNYHQERLEKYAQVKEISVDKAIHRIMMMQKNGVNIAEHMSLVIGVKHQVYKDTLRKLGENHEYIR